ncbi:hypothetical protein SLS62_010982 [Diatrype stigma]|uniref:HMG box domain-containing protein n=1 Tax=Diatrype stigma TaxID=117547 RepID=A0AAN9U6V4_9PEZI
MSSEQSFDLGDFQPAKTNNILTTWDDLRVQVSQFNSIISIPANQYQHWTAEDKKIVQSLMKQTTGKDNVTYAHDMGFPDRVYLGSFTDFQNLSVAFVIIPTDAIPGEKLSDLKLPNSLHHAPELDFSHEGNMNMYQEHHREPRSGLEPRNEMAPHMGNTHAERANNFITHQPFANENEANGKEKKPPTKVNGGQKAPRTKAPKSGVTRPLNCWMLFLRHIRVEILEDHPGMKAQDVIALARKIWKGYSEQQKYPFKEMAKREAWLHKIRNPDYVYNPRKPSEIKRRAKKQ